MMQQMMQQMQQMQQQFLALEDSRLKLEKAEEERKKKEQEERKEEKKERDEAEKEKERQYKEDQILKEVKKNEVSTFGMPELKDESSFKSWDKKMETNLASVRLNDFYKSLQSIETKQEADQKMSELPTPGEAFCRALVRCMRFIGPAGVIYDGIATPKHLAKVYLAMAQRFGDLSTVQQNTLKDICSSEPYESAKHGGVMEFLALRFEQLSRLSRCKDRKDFLFSFSFSVFLSTLFMFVPIVLQL